MLLTRLVERRGNVEPLGGVAMVWMVGVGDGVEGLVESWNAAAIRWSVPFTADIAWIPDVGFALPDGGDGWFKSGTGNTRFLRLVEQAIPQLAA